VGLSFHLYFNGQCQEAFEFYAENLQGVIGTMLAFKNSPAATEVPGSWQDKIVHGNIVIQEIEIAGADVLPEQYQKPQGFYLLLGVNSETMVNTIFDKLSVGGNIILPPRKTFWSPCYAIVVDRFGVPWKINCGT
jgi:PhnB protein